MKRYTPWRLTSVWLIALVLAACTTTTTTPDTTNTAVSPEQTAVPALNPVTPTPEKVFTTAVSATAAADAAARPTATKPAPLATDAATDSQAGVLSEGAVLAFERAGGLKGIGPGKISWLFYPDGRVTSSDGRSWQVAPEKVADLIANLSALDFATFQASYAPTDTCCDRVTYTMTVQVGEMVYETAVMEGADAPQELFQAVDLINQFLLELPT